MNVAFLTPSVSRAAGGIFEIERRLGQTLAGLPETQVSVYGLQDQHTEADLPSWRPLLPRTFPVQGPRALGYSSALQGAFHNCEADLAHLHSLWMYPSVLIHRWGHNRKRPYVVTPNGMLEPWALKNSAWKKRIAALFYERRMLEGAACLQANTEKEAADIRAFGLKNPICIIPNGIDLPLLGNDEILKSTSTGVEPAEMLKAEKLKSEHQGSIATRQNFSISDLAASGRNVLLYLGRIHPKKGLGNLLKAWATVRKAEGREQRAEEWVLAIAGWDQGRHEAELKSLADELGIKWKDVSGNADTLKTEMLKGKAEVSVLFLGPQFGKYKAACYANCDAFILPSFSEGLPMVILEAWAYGKPVLMTPECNLPEAFTIGAALRIETSVDIVAQGLRVLFSLRDFQRQAIGAKGLALVQRKFLWPEVAEQMKGVYEWLLGGGSRPDCVQAGLRS